MLDSRYFRAIVSLWLLLLLYPLEVSGALPPLQARERWDESDLVVAGRVEGLYSRVVPVNRGTNTEYVAEIAVDRVHKGDSSVPERIAVFYWRSKDRPEYWVGDGGQRGEIQTEASMIFFLKESKPGHFRLLNPNGADRLISLDTRGFQLRYPEGWRAEPTTIDDSWRISIFPPQWTETSFGIHLRIEPVAGVSGARAAFSRLAADVECAPSGRVRRFRFGDLGGFRFMEALVTWKDDLRQTDAFTDLVRFLETPTGVVQVTYSASEGEYEVLERDAVAIMDSIMRQAFDIDDE